MRDTVLAPFVLARPGKPRFRYSNLGYMLAGHIAERLGDAPWKDLVRLHVAQPLGLSSMGFGPPNGGDAHSQPLGHRGLASALLTRHWRLGRPVAPDDPTAELAVFFAPAGLVHLSLVDLARYGAAVGKMASGRDGLVPAHVFADLIMGEGYAGGWGRAPGTIWHTGSNGLWYAELRIRQLDGTAVAFTTNIGSIRAMIAARMATRATLRAACT